MNQMRNEKKILFIIIIIYFTQSICITVFFEKKVFYAYACMCMCTGFIPGTCGAQKEAPDPLRQNERHL